MVRAEQLSEWERLANEATKGPWTHPGRTFVVSKSQKDEPVVADCNFHEAGQGPRNAAFIAAAREAVPQLIAEVCRLEKEASCLATMLACERKLNSDNCTSCHTTGPEDCYYCWREEAQKRC